MEPLFREVLGRVIAANRSEQCLTLRQMVKASGISYAYVWELEKGKKDCSSEMLEAIGGALGMSVSDLLIETVAEYNLLKAA